MSSNGELVPGDGHIQKLLKQLPPEEREFVLQLLAELGLLKDPAAMPFFVVFQFYLNLFKRIPANAREETKNALREALKTHREIQTQVDGSIEKVKGEVDRIEAKVERVDEIRQAWVKDTTDLLPKFDSAFNAAKKTAVEAYEAEVRTIAETELQEWGKEYKHRGDVYVRDVVRQGQIWASGAVVIALLVSNVASYWIGTQHGREAAVQEFGNQDWYTISEQLINRADNKNRLLACSEDRNPKCTLWMEDPPRN